MGPIMAKKKASKSEVVIASGDELGELLRTIIDASEMTRYAIAQATGIKESGLSRSYNGKTGTSLAMLASVGELVGYRVVVRVEKIE